MMSYRDEKNFGVTRIAFEDKGGNKEGIEMNQQPRNIFLALFVITVVLFGWSCGERTKGKGEPLSEKQLKRLIRDLDSKDIARSEKAIDALVEVKDSAVTEALIGALNHETVRKEAAKALEKLGASAAPDLVAVLEDGTSDATVKRQIASALGKIGAPEAACRRLEEPGCRCQRTCGKTPRRNGVAPDYNQREGFLLPGAQELERACQPG